MRKDERTRSCASWVFDMVDGEGEVVVGVAGWARTGPPGPLRENKTSGGRRDARRLAD
jgi:hypothetical protein